MQTGPVERPSLVKRIAFVVDFGGVASCGSMSWRLVAAGPSVYRMKIFDTQALVLGDCEYHIDNVAEITDLQHLFGLLFLYRVRLCFAIRLAILLRPISWFDDDIRAD